MVIQQLQPRGGEAGPIGKDLPGKGLGGDVPHHLSFGVGANIVDFLKNIFDERCRIFTIVQDMEGRPHLPDMGIRVERGDDGCEGNRDINQ